MLPPLRLQSRSSSRRSHSSSATATATAPTPNSSSFFSWHRLALAIRVVRIPVLIVAVYSLGYQQGIIDCTKQPLALQHSILQAVLLNAGINNNSSNSSKEEDTTNQESLSAKTSRIPNNNHKVHVVTIHKDYMHHSHYDYGSNSSNKTSNSLVHNAQLSQHWSTIPPLSHEDELRRRRHYQVAAVGSKILDSARRYIANQLDQAIQDVINPGDGAPSSSVVTQSQIQQLQAKLQADETVQFWLQAQLRLDGEDAQQQNGHNLLLYPSSNPSDAKRVKGTASTTTTTTTPWQFLFLESPAPNAFVTEILPQRFFITSSMLEIATTPDEWAIVLGHEVSHLILGHVSDTNRIETVLRTVEVLLLSLDPTAGLVSMVVMGVLYAARQLVSAAYSRDNERQADELGIQLAAAACYDTHQGSHVMYKMHQQQQQLTDDGATSVAEARKNKDELTSAASSVGTTVSRLMDSHPPSLERWQRMEEAATTGGENYQKYNHCATLSRRFYNALWSSSKNSQTKSTVLLSKQNKEDEQQKQ